jgi:hypothetical protein
LNGCFTAKPQRRKERPQRRTFVKIINPLNFMVPRYFEWISHRAASKRHWQVYSAPKGRQPRLWNAGGPPAGSEFSAPKGRQRLAVGEERSEEPTEHGDKNTSPEGATAGAPASTPSPALPPLPPLRGLLSKPPQTVGSSLRSSPTAKRCRPSGALLLHRKERRTNFMGIRIFIFYPSFVSLRLCGSNFAFLDIESSDEPEVLTANGCQWTRINARYQSPIFAIFRVHSRLKTAFKTSHHMGKSYAFEHNFSE